MNNNDNNRTETLLLRPAEAAEQLGVSRTRCYQLLKSRTIPSVKIGSSVRVPTTQLKRWINDQIEEEP
jgi:excisionase family DNA binding protein